jgi:carbonic anhydrase/acetyltransferase-like protein (isoleucine patch superfamily)
VLTSEGIEHAGAINKRSPYLGPAPVEISDYVESVNQQRLQTRGVRRKHVEAAFADVVLDERLVDQIGPALNSGGPIFLYGKPGNGKTTMSERIARLFKQGIFVPYCIWADGEVVQVYDEKLHVKIPHIGTVIIEDDVEIGSCTCIDRAKFAATRIGRGSKLDNLVQVAHNVEVGPLCIIAGAAGMAGSVKLGSGVVLGGASAIRDHVTIGDRTRVAMYSAVYQDTEPDAVVSGIPADTHTDALRAQAALRRLPDLMKKVRELQREVKELQALRTKSD